MKFLILMLFPIILVGQEKIYEGNFTDECRTSTMEQTCKIKYKYINNSNDERILNGPIQINYGQYYITKGFMSNNKKVDLWTKSYVNKYGGNLTKFEEELSGNFDENNPTGIWKKNKVLKDIKSNKIIEKLNFVFSIKNGEFSNSFKYTFLNSEKNTIINGMFKNGFIDSVINFDITIAKIQYKGFFIFKNGILEEFKFIENSTGELFKQNCNSNRVNYKSEYKYKNYKIKSNCNERDILNLDNSIANDEYGQEMKFNNTDKLTLGIFIDCPVNKNIHSTESDIKEANKVYEEIENTIQTFYTSISEMIFLKDDFFILNHPLK